MRGILRFFADSSHDLGQVFITDFNSDNGGFFINFFVRIPKELADWAGGKKGEKQAESLRLRSGQAKICGKVALD